MNGIVPFPARNLTAESYGRSVVLEWLAPQNAENVTGYRIYRGTTLLSQIDASNLTYTDWNIPVGRYRYSVSTVYSGTTISARISTSIDVGYENFTLGSGTGEHNNTVTGPINTSFRSMRGQFIYTRAELNAAGLHGPVSITSLGFFPTSISSMPLPSFNIRLKHTSASSPTAHDNGPFASSTIVGSYTPTQGSWCMINLSTPFAWNGVDNILFDTAFNRVDNSESAGTIRITQVTNGYRYVASNTANQVTATTSSHYNWKPQLRLSVACQSNISFQLNPTFRNFGNTPLGTTSRPFTFTITNFGPEELSINSIEITGADRTNFSIVDVINFPRNIQVTQALTFDAVFTPISAGSKFATMDISHNASGSSSQIALSGVGTFAICSINLTEVDFGGIALNQTSAPTVITIRNTGTANLIVESINLSTSIYSHTLSHLLKICLLKHFSTHHL
jgi:hypothetical protein